MPKKLNPTRIEGSNVSLDILHNAMRKFGCDGCPLSELDNKGPVVLKGDTDSPDIMIIGEAPGKFEDLNGVPFDGPAGKLLDETLAQVDIKDKLLISNVVMCRPKAVPGSGKENNKPTKEHIDCCRPYIKYVINKTQPKLIILMGSTAVQSLLPEVFKQKRAMGELVGGMYFNIEEFPGIVFTIEYHPAYLLRKKGNKEVFEEMKYRFIQRLSEGKDIIKEMED